MHTREGKIESNAMNDKITKVDRMIALGMGAVALATYLLTLAPSVSFWDSGEYITASWTAGIPHPPGVPLFVLLGRFSAIIFSFLPGVAMRVNLLCAFAGAATIALLARLVQRWGRRMDLEAAWYRPMSVLAALIATFSYSIWRNSNATETYATALLLTFIILWLFDCWIERYGEGKLSKRSGSRANWGEAKHLLLISYLIILAVANHGSVPLVTGPPILLVYLIYAFKGKSDLWRKPWFLPVLLGLVFLAFSIHLYMPIRAIQKPEVNETDASHWENFEKAFTREQYGRTSILERKGPFPEQLKLYMKYLFWQSGRIVDGWNRLFGRYGSVAATVMRILLMFGAIYGLVILGMRRPRLLLYLGFLFLMSSVLFIFFILNFKTGPEGTSTGEVRERDYFFGASFSLFAIFAGIGLVSIFRDLIPNGKNLVWTTLAVPLLMFGANHYRCDRSNSFFARDYGINLLETCPENAVLITNGDNDTFPLWFAQGVLGVRRDVIVSNLSLMNTNWYVHQLVDKDSLLLNFDDAGLVDSLRPVYVWGPHHFHVGEEGMPMSSPVDGAIMRATFTQAWPWGITDSSLAVAIPMEGMVSQGALTMQDLVLLNIIKNRHRHGRDVCFAGTVAAESRRFLETYQLMEGIIYRILDRPMLDAVNGEKGRELMSGYLYTGVEDPSVFKCDQTVQLLRNYVSAYHKLAYYYLARGDVDAVKEILDASAKLFVTLPDQWKEILPARAMLVSKLVDGISGPAAAIDTIMAIAEDVMSAADERDDERLRDLASTLYRIASGGNGGLGYAQEAEYLLLMDEFDDGSAAFAWLRVELALIFSNYVGAWKTVEDMEKLDGEHSSEIHRLAKASLQELINIYPVGYRMNPDETGLWLFFSVMDSSDDPILPADAGSIMLAMLKLAEKDRIMGAVSAGLVLSGRLDDDKESAMVRNLALRMLLDPEEETRTWAEWFIRERNRVSPEELAYMSCLGGRTDLMYTALATVLSDRRLEEILDDLPGYLSDLPSPGRASGSYAWINKLAGEP